MRTMIINTLGLLMVAFAMFLIFKKIKALLPSVLGSALNNVPAPVTNPGTCDIPDTDSENEYDLNNMSNIIELDEEDIDVDDIDSDDEIVLSKNSSGEDDDDGDSDESDDESVTVEEPVAEEPVEEPVVEEPVAVPIEKPIKPMKKPKSLKPRKGNTIKI